MSNAFVFLFKTLFELYIMVVLLRVWLQWAKVEFYNPFSQFVVKVTQPIVGPLRKVIPAIGPIDTASVLVALVLSGIELVVINLIAGGGIPPVLAIVFSAPLLLLSTIFQLLIYVVFASAILSWVVQGYHPVGNALNSLVDPLLRPIRRIIPVIGGLDLSPMVLLLVIYFIRILLQDLLGSF
ncbi:YggT family protein [Gallaecimonas mangrovi]|uniref:YggT family protein n=1 Tax=Gallaecimonas mangrovi TaxID=2291597 RepID=UPI000E2090A3|nr:YggT family protein [Gallaecimonas mangrovi]